MLFSTLHGVLVRQEIQFADVGGKSQKYRTSPWLSAADTVGNDEIERIQHLQKMSKKCKDIYNHWLDKAFKVLVLKHDFYD